MIELCQWRASIGLWNCRQGVNVRSSCSQSENCWDFESEGTCTSGMISSKLQSLMLTIISFFVVFLSISRLTLTGITTYKAFLGRVLLIVQNKGALV